MGLFGSNARVGASAAADYEIEKSLRCNQDDTAHLTRAFDEAGNRKTFTLSGWYKFTKTASQHFIWMVGADGNNQFALIREGVTQLNFECMHSSSQVARFYTAALLRDPAAWYHLVLSIDTTQSTDTNRMKFYINGVEATMGGQGVSTQYPALNLDFLWGENSVTHYMAKRSYSLNANDPSDYYMADSYYIDGLALGPGSFGKTNAITGQWIPKKYGGSYGNAGYYLNFSDNSGTTATTLGKDSSGNSNNWTPNNYSVAAGDGNDSKTDTPTSNKATISPLLTQWTESATLSNGNLKLSGSAGFKNISTIGFAGTSKFYYEGVRTSAGGWQLLGIFIGATDNPSNALSLASIYGFASTGNIYQGGSSVSGGPTFGNDDVMGLKYNNGTLQIYKNGTVHGTSISSIPTTDTIFAYIANDNTSSEGYLRFSAGDWTQASGASVDATWELSQANLPEPTILKGTDHFGTSLWSGTSGDVNVTNLDFQPDFVWIKARSNAQGHSLGDAVRGGTKLLQSNTTAAEMTVNELHFNSNGFTSNTDWHTNGYTYASWAWKESATAGFDIVSYTGNGSARTISHSLGAVPEMMIVKRRDGADNWMVYHKGNGNTHYQELNSNAAKTDNTIWNDTTPTSSVFSLGTDASVNANSGTYIAYLFTGVEGYSKFGTYIAVGGSGSTPNNDGVFVYTGFKPAFILTKRSDSTSDWVIKDSVRSPHNSRLEMLFPNTTGAELNSEAIDFLSNGFKCRSASGYFDYPSGADFIYLAFAEHPLKNSNAA